MTIPPLTEVTSRAVLLPLDDIDTDQIISARFLTTTERRGLGTHLFADWRYGAIGTPHPDFVLNTPANRGRQVLVAGRNFDCGSSREHAPWALADWGFRGVVSSSFADIFRNNALKNGIVPVQLGAVEHERLVARLRDDHDLELGVNVETLQLTADDEVWPFPLAPFARLCLLDGIDQLGYLLGATDEIARYEAGHPPTVSTLR